MESAVIVAIISGIATIAAAIITARAQRPRQPADPPPNGEERGTNPQPANRDEPVERPDKAETGDPTGEAEAVDEPIPINASDPGELPKDYVLLPCPACDRKLRMYPRMWFKRVRCRPCGTLFKPGMIPGTSRVIERGAKAPTR